MELDWNKSKNYDFNEFEEIKKIFLCSNISACTYFRKLSASLNISACTLMRGETVIISNWKKTSISMLLYTNISALWGLTTGLSWFISALVCTVSVSLCRPTHGPRRDTAQTLLFSSQLLNFPAVDFDGNC